MKNKKIFSLIVVAVLLVTTMFTLSACSKRDVKILSARDFEAMGVRPTNALYPTGDEFDDVDTVANGLSALSTDAQKGMYLYDTALENLKNVKYAAAYNNGEFLSDCGGENTLYDQQVMLKNQDEYFYCDYRLIKYVPVADMAILGDIFRSMGGVLSKRVYYKGGEANSTTQEYNDNWFDENNNPATDWNKATTTSTDPVVFKAGDEGDFQMTVHKVASTTVKDMVVTAESETDAQGVVNHYFKLTFSLDLDTDATAESVKLIQKSIGDPNAYYTSINYVVTVWDNGYFRSYDTEENWNAKVAILNVYNSNVYKWAFSYDQLDCNVEGYIDAQGLVG